MRKDLKQAVKIHIIIISITGILLTSCGLGNFDTHKRQLAQIEADALMKRIADGDALNDFGKWQVSVMSIKPILALLHDSCAYGDKSAVSIGNFYQTTLGKEDKISFFYKYYLKSDSLKICLIYTLGDSIRFTQYNIKGYKK